MKKFAIFHSNRELDRSGELTEVVAGMFDLIAAEYDDGLCFIQSKDSAASIERSITEQFEITLGEILYVVELGTDISASGTVNTIRAIEEAL